MSEPLTCSALGRIRTSDTWFRKPLLYPLSYEGGDGAYRGANCCTNGLDRSDMLADGVCCAQLPLNVTRLVRC